MSIYVCNKCGWAHMGLTKESIEKSATEFVDYYNTLPADKQKDYYGDREVTYKDLVERYNHCFNCGGSHLNFHPEVPEDKIPYGCTIQGILLPE